MNEDPLKTAIDKALTQAAEAGASGAPNLYYGSLDHAAQQIVEEIDKYVSSRLATGKRKVL